MFVSVTVTTGFEKQHIGELLRELRETATHCRRDTGADRLPNSFRLAASFCERWVSARKSSRLRQCPELTSARAMIRMRPNGVIPSRQDRAGFEPHPRLGLWRYPP